MTLHNRFSGWHRECVRRSLPEAVCGKTVSIVGWIKRKRIHRLWKCCWWIRHKNPRLNRSAERSRRSPPYTFTAYQRISGFSIRLCSGLTFKSRYCPRSGLAKDVFAFLVSFFLLRNESPVFGGPIGSNLKRADRVKS